MSSVRMVAPFWFALIISLTTCTSAALAQPAKPKSSQGLASTLKGSAADAYQTGRVLYQERDFVGAYLKFKSAHALQPDPRLLWNMAVCQKQLLRYREVRALTERYIERAQAENLITPAEEKIARDLLATLRSLISRVRIEVDQPDVAVSVDGESLGKSPLAAAREVDIGRRVFVFEKPGFRAVKITHEVRGGDDIDVVRAQMVALTGQLTVTTDADASIWIDGVQVGAGRFRGPLPPGRHHIRLKAPKRKPAEREADLREGESVSFDVQLEPELISNKWLWAIAGGALLAGAAAGGYFALQNDNGSRSNANTLGEVHLSIRR